MLKPAELLGLGVMREGPGALGVTPGFKTGGGGVCGIGIASSPGLTPGVAVPPLIPLALNPPPG